MKGPCVERESTAMTERASEGARVSSSSSVISRRYSHERVIERSRTNAVLEHEAERRCAVSELEWRSSVLARKHRVEEQLRLRHVEHESNVSERWR